MKESKIFLVILFLLIISVHGSNLNNLHKSFEIQTNPDLIELNCNNIRCVFSNNGIFAYDIIQGNWGLEWPAGSGKSPLFAAGLMLGAQVNGEVRVTGVQHGFAEWQPGNIDHSYQPGDPQNEKFRWYELTDEGNDDRENWPVEQGAPVDEKGHWKQTGQQTIFSVWNDMAEHGYYGSEPLGAEVHQTAWGFNEFWPFGDMIFIKWKIINKSNQPWEKSYITIWADPDVGDAGDDLVGCDTTQNLAFAYNGKMIDQKYDKYPPAMGIKILQGALMDHNNSTVHLPDGRNFTNKKEQKMNAFVFYVSNNSNSGDPQIAEHCYHYMQGRWQDGTPIVDDSELGTTSGPAMPYMFYGDPEKSTGWLDQYPADRRMMINIGPFDMAPWQDKNNNGQPELEEPGVQEFIAAIIIAQGTSHLNSVTKLKNISSYADWLYQNNFEMERVNIEPPELEYSVLSNEIILKWSNNAEFDDNENPLQITIPFLAENFGEKIVKGYEEYIIDDSTYNFSGYSIYQYSDVAGSDPVLVNHQQKKSDLYNLKRYFRITKNYHPLCGEVDAPLSNAREYYFSVIAEATNQYATPEILESSENILTLVPQNIPGRKYDNNYAYKDTIPVTYQQRDESLPTSVGKVIAIMVDPTQTTGEDYEVNFNDDGTWNLKNLDENKILLANQTNQTGDENYEIAEGLQIKVTSPPPGLRDIVELNEADEIIDNNISILDNSLGSTNFIITNIAGQYNQSNFVEDFDRYDCWEQSNVIIDFNDSSLTWNFITDEINFNTVNGHPYYAPFAVYKEEYLSGKLTRLFPAFYDTDESGTWNISYDNTNTAYWIDPIYGGPCYEPVYAWIGYDEENNVKSYDPALENQYISENSLEISVNNSFASETEKISHPFLTNVLFSMYTEEATLPYGNKIKFITSKQNNENDIFRFTAPAAPTDSLVDRKLAMKLIKAVPNPYYGCRDLSHHDYGEYITFTNLPAVCELIIFDLAGNKVFEYQKNSPGESLFNWDLKNSYGGYVSSGVYVFVVKTKNLGKKTGKFALFQSQ
jgi:hypothetical protein